MNDLAGADEEAKDKPFQPDAPKNKQMFILLNLAKETNLFYNLLIVINTVELGPDGRYTNQYNQNIQKFGQTRLRALELIYTILQFFPNPSYGALAQAQIAANPELKVDQPPHPDLAMDKYITKSIRRQLVRTCLVVLREYGYCCIANQFSIMIFDKIKTLFDVADVVEL